MVITMTASAEADRLMAAAAASSPRGITAIWKSSGGSMVPSWGAPNTRCNTNTEATAAVNPRNSGMLLMYNTDARKLSERPSMNVASMAMKNRDMLTNENPIMGETKTRPIVAGTSSSIT